MDKKILLINTAAQNSAPFTEQLMAQGFKFEYCDSTIEGVYKLKQQPFVLICLNLAEPQLSDFISIEQLKKIALVPIMVFANTIKQPHLLQALTLGAHDYLPTHLDPREILARIYVCIGGNSSHINSVNKSKLSINDVILCSKTRTVYCQQQPLILTGLEFELLHLLMLNAGLIVGRDIISKSLFNKALSINDRSLDMHISNLRKKIAAIDPSKKIQTVRCKGYIFLL